MLFFLIKESFKLISRAKFSFLLSLISTSISVILIVSSILLLVVSDHFQSRIKKNISIHLFLKEGTGNKDIEKLRTQLESETYISSVIYIDKKSAAENFIKETGEDFRKILDYNPLPASFRIFLKEEYAEPDSLKNIISYVEHIEVIDEVVYQDEFISKVLAQLNSIKKYIFIITAALVLISIYIVYSTLQLIINSKYEELDTMKLVGAKMSTIKMPIILNGILIGLFAGIISLVLFFFLFHYLDLFMKSFGIKDFYNPYYLLFIVFVGPVLSVLVSIVTLRKLNLKI